ncbi:deoxyribonuclease IV [Patescibacteria group bacterium]
MQKIGAHVSAAGGARNAPINAHAEKCETFQFFINPPQTYKFKRLTKEEIEAFHANCQQYGFDEYYVHASYLMNLASLQNKIRYGAITLLKKALEESDKLGVKGVIFHAGTAKGHPNKAAAIKQAIKSMNIVLDGYTGKTKLVIENSAGAGTTLGVTFKEVAQMLKGIKDQTKAAVCLDTQHAFASGYDWRTPTATNKTLNEFSKEIGMRKLLVVHYNDSKSELSSNIDRHAHIAAGHLGVDAAKNILYHPKLQNKSFILETPREGRAKDIKTLKQLRKG